jgi:hypothetical protein
VRRADNFATFMCRLSRNSGSINACKGLYMDCFTFTFLFNGVVTTTDCTASNIKTKATNNNCKGCGRKKKFSLQYLCRRLQGNTEENNKNSRQNSAPTDIRIRTSRFKASSVTTYTNFSPSLYQLHTTCSGNMGM